jgi:HSP20 family protein
MNHLIRFTYPRSANQSYLFANRSPWSGLESEIEQHFQSALAPRIPVEFTEDKDNAYVRAELPGVSREAINLELVDGQLNLSASRKQGEETISLTRSLAIPESVQADKVAATYENGVLTVTLPKAETAKPRKIALN